LSIEKIWPHYNPTKFPGMNSLFAADTKDSFLGSFLT
jgi:hypothetical protein